MFTFGVQDKDSIASYNYLISGVGGEAIRIAEEVDEEGVRISHFSLMLSNSKKIIATAQVSPARRWLDYETRRVLSLLLTVTDGEGNRQHVPVTRTYKSSLISYFLALHQRSPRERQCATIRRGKIRSLRGGELASGRDDFPNSRH